MERGTMSASFLSICHSITAETAANSTQYNTNAAGGLYAAVTPTPLVGGAIHTPLKPGHEHKDSPGGETTAQEVFFSLINAANSANGQNMLPAARRRQC